MRIRLSFAALYFRSGFARALTAFALVHLPATADSQKIWEEFSGEKAMEHVQRLVDLGPRPPASEAIEKSRAYIEKQLEGWGWKVTRQVFSDDTPRGKIAFVNLTAEFRETGRHNKDKPSFLLCSHYDTKWFETIRFVGANDGGSSTGLLLELARVLAQTLLDEVTRFNVETRQSQAARSNPVTVHRAGRAARQTQTVSASPVVRLLPTSASERSASPDPNASPESGHKRRPSRANPRRCDSETAPTIGLPDR